MADPGAAPVEFSRPVDLARIGSTETVHEISATEAEREALARRLGLLQLARLEARVRLRRAHAGTQVHLAGHLAADVTQACVVSLEPVQNHVEEDFTVVYGELAEDADVSVDVDEESVVEPLPVGSLDIGEAVAQELALALDPYPHAPGAVVESAPGADQAPAERSNPFSVLANLRKTEG
ncbi:MAG TPA: DUF177 domain-containing protein [Alphaproteobacteria bacterium]|nr:DUF177 domain-containing protein [Alphaproteobacteria bacterium]